MTEPVGEAAGTHRQSAPVDHVVRVIDALCRAA